MNDLTILYYTANRLQPSIAKRIRDNLLEVARDIPIISISHEPIDFGHNVCVGKISYSTYSIYKQILIGAMCAHTEYVACCEDDALYPSDHFYCRPPKDTFGYNINKWWVNPTEFFYRPRINMIGCIVETVLMVEILSERFFRFPRVLGLDELHGWGEPGKEKHISGLKNPPISTFSTLQPIIAFNHSDSTGGKRRITRKHQTKSEIDGIGTASQVWRKFYGN
jgi:hypothetical protein